MASTHTPMSGTHLVGRREICKAIGRARNRGFETPALAIERFHLSRVELTLRARCCVAAKT